MQALVIGDLHFEDKPRGLMKAQAAAVKQICVDRCGDSNQLIFLGDLMMHRNPRPTVLLALKELLDDIVNMGYEIHILRGNHDSVTKADDGVTALSLFESKNIHVYTQYHEDHKNEWVFIPHYED